MLLLRGLSGGGLVRPRAPASVVATAAAAAAARHGSTFHPHRLSDVATFARADRHPRDLPGSGYALLQDPSSNCGQAFTNEERWRYGLRGLLPARVLNPLEQGERMITRLRHLEDPLEQYKFLTSLGDRNRSLFYSVLVDNLVELMPVVYTPTVGKACQNFSYIFRRPRGLYISAPSLESGDPGDRGRIKEVLDNWPYRNIRCIVVTDGQRILGLGDLGSNGMGIPIGKLDLYTACAGVHPNQCLPVVIDAGCDNEEVRDNEWYLGLRQPRIPEEQLDEVVDEFMGAVTQKYGADCLVQFEDFANHNAFKFLQRYRDNYCTFNDDIQGTAAVALSGLITGSRHIGRPIEELTFLFHGAGEAGTGIAHLLVDYLVGIRGMSEAEAKKKVWLVDSKGLVVANRMDSLHEHKKYFAHEHEGARTLLAAVNALEPAALVGVSGVGQSFSQEVVERMADLNDRPMIFALSNPTTAAECTAEQAIHWSNGRAVFASGSPFNALKHNGKLFQPGQGNNAYVFPGIGLGTIASGATRVPQETFLAAAMRLSDLVRESDLENEHIYPQLSDIRDVSHAIATDVVLHNLRHVPLDTTRKYVQMLCQMRDDMTDDQLEEEVAKYVDDVMFIPDGSRLYAEHLDEARANPREPVIPRAAM